MEHADEHIILATLTGAVFLGTMAQLLAERFKIPAILPLLLFGIAAGTSSLGFGLVQPDALSPVLEVFIHLGVAIILFEGGLSLDLAQLARVGGAVRNLLTVGVVVTGVGAAALAHWATGIPWATAALFGAIVTVTGPTVIAPLLRHMVAPREVKTVLLSEGLIIDPIGVVLAYFVLQWIERAGIPVKEIAGELLLLTLTGAALGFLAGSLAKWLASSRFCGRELRNLAVLAILMLVYFLSEKLAHQSGLLAAVVMGVTVSGADIPDLVPLKTFKEQLTNLVIAVLFILLSAQLDISAMTGLGWGGIAVVAGLIFLIRPLAVLTSVHGEEKLGGREKVLLSMTAPRGIVAAAFASLAARQLQREGLAGGSELEGLVYLVILVTGAWATIMAVVLPHWLGYRRDPARRLTVLVGASELSARLAELLSSRGRKAVILDSSRNRIVTLRGKGINAQFGDARDSASFEAAGVEEDTSVLVLTANDELNLLVAELVREEFGVEHPVVALQQPSEEFGVKRRAWVDQLSNDAVSTARWSQKLASGDAELRTISLEGGDSLEALRAVVKESGRALLAVCGWKGNEPSFGTVLKRLAEFDEVTFIVMQGETMEQLGEIERRALESKKASQGEGTTEEGEAADGARPETEGAADAPA